MSALGQKRTWRARTGDVRFTKKSGIVDVLDVHPGTGSRLLPKLWTQPKPSIWISVQPCNSIYLAGPNIHQVTALRFD